MSRKKGNTKRTKKTNSYSPFIEGKIDFAPHGTAFVMVEGMTVDIKIDKKDTANALPGDTVEVAIIKIGRTSKRPVGKIISVKKRAKHVLTARAMVKNNHVFCIPTGNDYYNDIYIPSAPTTLKDNDKVFVEIVDWNIKNKNPNGKILEIISGKNVHDIAMKEILMEYGFTLQYPEAAMKECEHLKFEINAQDMEERRDMRSSFTLTIDPFDAKDFDDAISYEKLENGHIELGVHIADVAHYVKEKSALDTEAFARSTSVYLPDRVLPMLPEKISNELCSLRPHEDKFTFSTVFILNSKFEIINTWIGRTITHSNHRFTYEEVQEIIDGKEGVYKDEILALNKISKYYRKKRFDKDAINFNSEEIRFKLNEYGDPIEILVKKSLASHQLIEELMLLANRTVAEFVKDERKQNKDFAFPYRIHDEPDITKILQFGLFAGKFGYTLDLKDKKTLAKSFNYLLEESLKHPEQHILHTLGIRTMAKAIYSIENVGHYGLGFEDYSHFTSPIRRYPDIIAHRVLWSVLHKEKNNFSRKNKAEEQLQHCSKQERQAMEAERAANKYKQIQFMQQFLGETFDAVISGVAAFGIWCQTLEHSCEGFVSIKDLGNDEFVYKEDEYYLIGKRSKQKFQIGHALKIQVAAANLEKRKLDFVLAQD